jgi:RHS repeat-associated protein
MKTFHWLILFLSLFSSSYAQYSWSDTNVSGGESNGVDVRTWTPDIDFGDFLFNYNFYSVPDSVVITAGGQTIFSSGGYVSGTNSALVSFDTTTPGSSSLIQVTMNPQGPRPGTAWTYFLSPTARPTLESIQIYGLELVNENSSTVYTLKALYSNGTNKVVEATSWRSSVPAAFAIIPSGKRLGVEVRPVTKDTSITLSATYSESGQTLSTSGSILIKNSALTDNLDEQSKLDPDNRPGIGGPIDPGTGAESFYKPLLTLSGARDLEFGIRYNSNFSSTVSEVGLGWSHDFDISLNIRNDSITVIWSSTRANLFTYVADPTGAYYYCPDTDVRFDRIERQADGSYTLTKPDQRQYFFSSSGGFTGFANARGQRINVTSSSLREPISGATINFTFQSGRITRLTDSLSRSVSLAYSANGLLSSVTDADGLTTTYAYNTQNKLSTVTAADGTVIYRNTYDATGRAITQDDALSTNGLLSFSYDESSRPGFLVTTVTDRTGKKTLYTYDGRYRLISIKDPLGRTLTHAYDADGNRISTTDPLGRITRTEYDSHGQPVRILAPDGGETRMEYDAKDNITRLTLSDGTSTTYVYDSRNNPLTVTNALGQQVVRTYDTNSLLTSETTPLGNKTTFAYTSGRLTAVTDPLGQITRLTYDAAGRVLSSTDAAGKITTYEYSAQGDLLEILNPVGAKIVNTYDVRHRLLTTTDPVSGVTRREYDGNRNLTKITDALGGITLYAYDGEDRLLQTTDPLGRVSRSTYDAVGQLLTVANPLGQTTRFAYDSAGNVTSVTDPTGAVTTTTYSAINLPLTVRDALSRTSTLRHDTLGRTLESADPLKRATTRTYDELGRLVTATDAMGFEIKRAYDADGRMTSLANAAGAITTFAFDKVGRQTEQSTPAGRKTAYAYDARGLVTRRTESSGQAANLTYDNAARLTQLADPVGTITYAYDAKNRLLTVGEAGKTLTRVYDALDRLVRFTDAAGNIINYAYDAVGDLTRITYADGKIVDYAYDAADRLLEVTDWAGRKTAYAYDAAGRLTRTTRPNGTRQERVYDKSGQLTTLRELTSSGTQLVGYAITYDAAGQIVSEKRTPVVPPAVPVLVDMDYNADDQLLTYNGSAATHDPDGNLTNGPLGAGFAAFTYDSRNRLTSAGGITYEYDAENRRTASTRSGVKTTYVNNPNAALWQVLSYQAGTAARTTCVYGMGLIYTETDGQPLYHHYDLRGSTVATTNATGTVTYSAAYDAYGRRDDLGGTAPATPFLFVGQYGVMTDASGLYYSRARYYHPVISRFLNADPIGFEGGMNWYAYTGGSPLIRIDPSGHFWWFIPVAIEAGLTAWDAWETYKVVNNPNSTLSEKGLATSTFLAGLGLPGAGYGAAGRYVDDAVDAAKAAKKVATRVPGKASEIVKWAEGQGWKRTQTANGPIKYVDENGVVRVTVKQGSSRAPGSGSPHVELRDATGRRVDPDGNPVTRKSPENHTPIEWDLD